MPIAPPAKDSAPTPANLAALRVWLASIQAFDPRTADRPWRFYEEIDAYLGPWGERGYPIGYGKKYCQRFFNDATLRGDPYGRRWMEQTMLLLQQEIQRFVLLRYAEGTLSSVCERDLRHFAFGSHSRAYVRAGFAQVALQSPAVIANVAYLLRPELSLRNSNRNLQFALLFGVVQVCQTLCSAVPRALPDADLGLFERVVTER